MTVTGSCLCGGVAYAIDGWLSPIQLCHATRCRKATGAAYAPELITPQEGFRFTRGEALVRTHRAPILHEPPAYVRAFCGTCGSPLPAAIEDTPYVVLNAGTLDDDPGTRPFRHAFVDQRACWHELTGDLPAYEGRPPPPGDGDLPG